MYLLASWLDEPGGVPGDLIIMCVYRLIRRYELYRIWYG